MKKIIATIAFGAFLAYNTLGGASETDVKVNVENAIAERHAIMQNL